MVSTRGRASLYAAVVAASLIANSASSADSLSRAVGGGLGPSERGDGAQTRPAALPESDDVTVFGVFAGYGFAQRVNGSVAIDVASAGVRWSRLDRVRGPGWLRGRPAFSIEVLPLMTFDQTPRPLAAGFNLVLEHRLQRSWAALPVVRIGAGMLASTEGVPPHEARLSFSVLAGFGVELPWRDGRRWSLEYRLHHVSNAGIGTVNPGINAHTLLAGVNFYR